MREKSGKGEALCNMQLENCLLLKGKQSCVVLKVEDENLKYAVCVLVMIFFFILLNCQAMAVD